MHEFEYKGWKYRLVSVEEATVELISAGKLIGKVVVPEEVECQDKKYKVIAIRGERYDKAHFEYPSDKRRKPIVSYTTITNPVFIGQALHSVQEKLEVVLPSSLKTIGNFAFYDCSNLTSVTLSDGIISIDECAFCKCSNLTSVTIPNGVTYIGKSAFAKCSNLTSVTIPNSVTSIGQCCFLDCSNLTSVTIPNGVTYIEKMIFCDCRSLTSITIPNSVTGIDFGAFVRCVALTSITIPHSVTWIHKDAFDGCRGVIVTIENDEGKVRSQNASLSSAKIHYVGKPKEQHVMPAPKEAAAPAETPTAEPVPAPATPVAAQPAETPKPAAPTINLETLIAAALVDGIVTDKERAILCKKVKEAGGDVDEFEMLLDARIYEAQQKNQPAPAPKAEPEAEPIQKPIVEATPAPAPVAEAQPVPAAPAATTSAEGQMTIAQLAADFNNQFGSVLRVYNGRSKADDSLTLQEVGLTGNIAQPFDGNQKVGEFIEQMGKVGLKVKVYTSDEWVACLDGLTLSATGQIKKNATKADMEKML